MIYPNVTVDIIFISALSFSCKSTAWHWELIVVRERLLVEHSKFRLNEAW